MSRIGSRHRVPVHASASIGTREERRHDRRRAGLQVARNPRYDAPMHPRVTIAMPAYNEACIASVQAQDYPREHIEILVADGRSTDRTREILAELAADDPRIRVIDNPGRLQACLLYTSPSPRD